MNHGERATPKSVQWEPFSLLWPDTADSASDASAFVLDEAVMRDLELEKLYWQLAGNDKRYLEIEPILRKIPYDANVIAYRQNTFSDLLRFPELADCLEGLLPYLESLKRKGRPVNEKDMELHKMTFRLSELENFILCINRLGEAFLKIPTEFDSAGWRRLRDSVMGFRQNAIYGRLTVELPELFARLRDIRSIAIGVNLDVNLIPCEATLLSINTERYSGKSESLFHRLFPGDSKENEGIAQLHAVPLEAIANGRGRTVQDLENHEYAVNPLLLPLFGDLQKIIVKTTEPINRALNQYLSINTALLGDLKQEIVFYLRAVKMTVGLQKCGLPFCKPRILPAQDRMTDIRSNYNVNLALSLAADKGEGLNEAIVKNDVRMDQDGSVLVITGPNSGGKTTYLQAIGLTHILAQLGLFVPGEAAAMSPVDRVYSHFPTEEKIDRGTGRLGDESKRISEIFSSLTSRSLLLMNESLSSTSAAESFYIARDILQLLCELGTRTAMTTHLYGLALSAEEISRSVASGNKIVSMVAGISGEESDHEMSDAGRTFRIAPGVPTGNSYAREIAERFGVSHEQLSEKLRLRGEL